MASKRTFSVLLVALMVSGLAACCYSTAQAASSTPKPSVPEFSIKYVDNSYDIPTSTSTDPFTGSAITNPAQHIQNETLQIVIKNQTISASDYLYYDVRMKGHFSENWDVIAHVQANPHSEYTVLTYALEGNNASGNFGGNLKLSSSGGIAEFQVQAQVWHYVQSDDMFGSWYMIMADSSDWSSTQTISIPENVPLTPTPAPQSSTSASTTPVTSNPPVAASDSQLTWLLVGVVAGLGVIVALLIVVVVFMRGRIRVLELKQNGN